FFSLAACSPALVDGAIIARRKKTHCHSAYISHSSYLFDNYYLCVSLPLNNDLKAPANHACP
ncbi:MAG: hypothetical protein KDC54_17065, partial [Lewinella sp.]|nr:hypothetical protein [Lewinella sp.]